MILHTKMESPNISQVVHHDEINSIDPVTDEVTQVILLVTFVILCGFISFFGVGANMINISVFARQGFKDNINISLMGLAVSDLVCSFSMFWISIFYNPLVVNTDLPVNFVEFACLTGALPHVCFNRITSAITSFITLERCFCIAMPLKVKNIVTPFRTKVIVISIFVGTVLLFSPFPAVNTFGWKFSVSQNRSILGILDNPEREIVDSVSFFLHSVLLSSSFLIIVVISTVILVVKLSEKTKWRQSVTAQANSETEAFKVKEKRVVKMITLISMIFIICYVPPTIAFMITVIYPEISIVGKLRNTFLAIWSVTFVLEAINSSVNIFVYYKMSTKFKETFRKTFLRFMKNK